MRRLQSRRGLRSWQRGTMLAGVAVIALAVGELAGGAAAKPSMQVLPRTTGLKYTQTVEVKAKNLPRGSGTIALTICGLSNKAGQRIPQPTADDCAGANDLNSGLVKLQQWKDGTFDQMYTLPHSGQKFGKNQRFCDSKHYCALVVADANPNNPAYYVSTDIFFVDQKAPGSTTTKPGSTTTKPKTTTTRHATTTTTRPLLSISAHGNASVGPNGGSGSGGVSVSFNPPSGSTPARPPLTLPSGPLPNPIPPQAASAVTEACGQLAQAVQQAGGDPTALTVACSTLVHGGGGAQLAALLQSPSLGCTEAASAVGGNQQLADACNQLATALQPYSSQLGGALAPVLGLLP